MQSLLYSWKSLGERYALLSTVWSGCVPRRKTVNAKRRKSRRAACARPRASGHDGPCAGAGGVRAWVWGLTQGLLSRLCGSGAVYRSFTCQVRLRFFPVDKSPFVITCNPLFFSVQMSSVRRYPPVAAPQGPWRLRSGAPSGPARRRPDRSTLRGIKQLLLLSACLLGVRLPG